MKRVVAWFSIMGGVLVIVGVAALQCGCEEAKGLAGLQVTPASVTLVTNGQTTVFSVAGVTNETLALPLTWTVQDENLGRITSSSGYTAIYQRFSPDGVNTVVVRDQYENEGYATVQQSGVSYTLALEATATSITIGQSATISISSSTVQNPVSWTLLSGPGSLAGSGASAAYSGTAVGTAMIQAEDANGASGVIAITVTDAADDGGDTGGGAGGA